MGYLFLLIALFSATTKGFCGKKTSQYTKNFKDAIFANCLRMLICVIVGLFVVIISDGVLALIPTKQTLFISALSGISISIFVVTWLICVRKNAYMMLDIFLLLSTLIPLIGSKILFNENIKIFQWFGMIVLFIAVVLMCSYNTTKTNISLWSLLLLLVCGVANGISDFSQKLFIKQVENGSIAVFNFYSYLFALMVLLLAFLFTPKKIYESSAKHNIKNIFLYIVIMAVCLFSTSFFRTLAAQYLDAVLLYPLSQGCSLILSSLMSVFLFKEKLNLKAIIGIITAFIGLIIINPI